MTQEHEGQKWVFIERSGIGVPTESLVNKQGVIPLEREWLRGPLSKDVSYRLVVSGDLGPREIGKLIKLLKAQQSVLEEDDEQGGLSDNDIPVTPVDV